LGEVCIWHTICSTLDGQQIQAVLIILTKGERSMKKKLITIAVAAALAPVFAMAADVTVYGRVHVSADSISGIAANKNNTALNSDSSRFGVMGDNDLGDGLKGLFQLESGVNAVGRNVPDGNGGPTPNGQVFSSGARDMFIGLAGNLGSIKAGRMGGANQWVYDSNLFADQMGDAGNFNSGRGVGGRLSGILMYQTPTVSGLNASLTYIPASSLDSGTTIGKNSYGAKLDYANMAANAHMAYFKTSTTTATVATDNTNASIAGSYDFGNAMFTAQLVNSKVNAGGVSTTQNVYNIGGKYNLGSNDAIKAQYSKAGSLTGVANSGANQIAIGYDHSLSKKMGIYAVLAKTTNEANAQFAVDGYGHGGNAGSLAVAGESPSAISIGMTYDF
jgi:predicted porin